MIMYSPHVMCVSLCLQSQRFLRIPFQDFSPYSGLLWDQRVETAVSVQLNPSRGIKVLSSKTKCHLKNIHIYIYILFNFYAITLEMLHAVSSLSVYSGSKR